MRLKTFIPARLLDPDQNDLFEIVKIKLKADNNTLSPNLKPIIKNLEFVEDQSNAQLVMLPMSWNYYFKKKRLEEVLAYVHQALKAGQRVLSVTSGDLGISQNLPTGCYVYRVTGYRSKLKTNEHIMPFALSDPIKSFFEDDDQRVINRPVRQKPIIGFCGMAPDNRIIWAKEALKVAIRNTTGLLGMHPYDRQVVMSSSRLRIRTMRQFQGHSEFVTNYVLRKKYRAGAISKEERKRTSVEYYQNQLESDFIVCVRGGGNFSVRLYETLAMGRIPVFVDTDSPLPNIGDLSWDNHLVRCSPKHLHELPSLVIEWMKGKDLSEVFHSNRKLWLDYLSVPGFWQKELKRVAASKISG